MEAIRNIIRNILLALALLLWVYSYYKMLCYLFKAIRNARRGKDAP